MVNITKLQRFLYSIQSTLIVTNTFLAASVCYSRCTGVSKLTPPCARECEYECVSGWAEVEYKWLLQKLEAENPAHLAYYLTMLYVAFKTHWAARECEEACCQR